MLNLQRFTSNISQKESLDLNKHDVQFANILLCSDSIHSKVRYLYYKDVLLEHVRSGRNQIVLSKEYSNYIRKLTYQRSECFMVSMLIPLQRSVSGRQLFWRAITIELLKNILLRHFGNIEQRFHMHTNLQDR